MEGQPADLDVKIQRKVRNHNRIFTKDFDNWHKQQKLNNENVKILNKINEIQNSPSPQKVVKPQDEITKNSVRDNKSLHYLYVQKESIRIDDDNAKLRKRLFETKPFERYTTPFLDKELLKNMTVERKQQLISPIEKGFATLNNVIDRNLNVVEKVKYKHT